MYKPIVIAYRNGSPVRLSDVANVTDGIPALASVAPRKRQKIANRMRRDGGMSGLRTSLERRLMTLVPDYRPAVGRSMSRCRNADREP